jgi:hypothetical protein
MSRFTGTAGEISARRELRPALHIELPRGIRDTHRRAIAAFLVSALAGAAAAIEP